MQTINQTFAASTTWELNIAGKYFTTIECLNPLNVRFYKGGQLLDLGNIQGLLAGLEVSDIVFDRVQIDVTGPDVVTVGIGNGNARYNRTNATVAITNNIAPRSAAFLAAQKVVTNASAQVLAPNASRQYLLIQNNDAAGDIYVQFGQAATLAAGVKIAAGGAYEWSYTQTTQAVHLIGSIANNPNVVVLEG